MRIAPSLAALLVTLSPLTAQAQEIDEPEEGRTVVSYYGDHDTPDISGLWLGSASGEPGVEFAPNRGPADDRPGTYWQPWPLPYTDEYQQIHDERVAGVQQGRAIGDAGARCRPFGISRMLSDKHYPDEIVQTPGQVTFFMFGTFPVTVWTDGRGHPDGREPSFNGHSIGYWHGDTLFVDTVGLNDQSILMSTTTPLSDQARLQWSVRRVMDDMLHVTITVFDPEALTEPVVNTAIWTRKSEDRWAVLDDQSCFENNNTNVSEEGAEPGFRSKF